MNNSNIFNLKLNNNKALSSLVLVTALLTASASSVVEAASIGNQGKYFTNKVTGASETITLSGNAATQTQTLNQAITRASNKNNGGVVIVKGNNILLNQVELKSNVRLEVQSGATIKMNDKVLFNIARDAGRANKLENVEITSTGSGRFTIDVNRPEIFKNAIPMRVGYVYNFALSNFNIDDNYTIFPSLFMVADSDARKVANNATYSRIPEKGVVQNIKATKVAAGYALIQLFSGKTMRLKNLDAEGGLTIRLEPGSGRPNDYLNQAGPRVGNIEDIRMLNIHNKEGMAAIFLKPHQKICPKISGKNITATDSMFAIMSNSSDSTSFTRGNFNGAKFDTPIKLTKTKNAAVADMGASSQYFVVESERNKYSKIADFPRDPSGRRWHTKPIVPVLIASALTQNNAGSASKGRFGITINGTPTTQGSLERNEKILYRNDALRLNGKVATTWIEK